MISTPAIHRTIRVLRAILLLFLALATVAGILFAVNGLFLAAGRTPETGRTDHPPVAPEESDRAEEIRVMAFHLGGPEMARPGFGFPRNEEIRRRLDAIAEIVKLHRSDLVFLSDATWPRGPGAVHSVRELAEAAEMHAWATGETYNFGLPFLRIAGGNAILSRYPLEAVANEDLAGRKPFRIGPGNPRILRCAIRVGGERVLLGAVHADSVDPRNNLIQIWQILGERDDRPTLLAGTFHAAPHSPSILAIRRSGRHSGAFDGPPTFPSEQPVETLDYIFGPADWTVTEHRAIPTAISDHFPVFTAFRLPGNGEAPAETPNDPTQPESSDR